MFRDRSLEEIKYALRMQRNVEEAKRKLEQKIKVNPHNPRLYCMLADFPFTAPEKRVFYEKARELDPSLPRSYYGLFCCDLCEHDYEMAKTRLVQYKEALLKKGMPCNTVLYDILLDDLLGIEDQEYVVDDSYLGTKLKGERYASYCELIEQLGEGDYEKAYFTLMCMRSTYDELRLWPAKILLERIRAREEKAYQMVKTNDEIKGE